VPNGVDPAAFAPLEPDPKLQRVYGLEGKAVVGYVSTMDNPREGQEILIEATARLVRAGRAVVCLLVGDGSRRPALEALARKSGVASDVVFTGKVPHAEVRRLYGLLDVFVVPRIDDRAARLVTPLKPFEALAMGRPLVVADLPALLEIAAPDERGLAFRAGDAGALAAALGTLLDRPELRRRLGEAGRSWVLAERTWDANGPRYRAAYEMAREARRAAAGRPR
jgi:glycosyltransferase involved in cell wall biosynthesis